MSNFAKRKYKNTHFFDSIKNMKERQSNIELLRIVIMVMIVIHHGIVHGLGIASLGLEGSKNLVEGSNMALWGGV